ncbi:unnamed protein product [Peniophora sp. CBMAI 1063]|nr:unnamed protein product [Peniophora sp. CBMAI 1063]
MLTPEQEGHLRLLVQHTMRAFYEPRFIIAMDQLARHNVIKDEELAGRLGLNTKEVNKIMAVLEKDGLVQVQRQNELKDGAQRSVARQYFYLDFKHFCDVVKWRMAQMRHIIDSKLRNELDNKGYVCPQCKKQYTPLEADRLLDMSRMIFACEVCHHELIDNEDDESVRGSQDRMERFNKQMRFILDGLRKSEEMVMPAFDVSAVIKAQYTEAAAAQAANGEPGAGLKIAGSSGPTALETNKIGVMLTVDKDADTVRREREAEAAARRQQNALPAWHLKSTVSGDLTALGIREAESASAHAHQDFAEMMKGDESLAGLGRVGPAIVGGQADGGDVKPVISNEPQEDELDQYYASLAATPALSQSVSTPVDDDFDVSGSRKRSRSAEDVGGGPNKQPRLDDTGDGAMVVDGDDPIVYVAGEARALSSITDADQERMTEDEYTAYAEAMMSM